VSIWELLIRRGHLRQASGKGWYFPPVAGQQHIRAFGFEAKMTFKNVFAVVLLLAVSLLPLACHESSNMAMVTTVIDGDTIIIEGGHHVRYIGIDAPDSGEFYYLEAKQINERLVKGKKVRLERDISDKDSYGRLLRYVYIGDDFVNAEIVRQGCAWAIAYTPDVKYQVYLEAMEKEARQLKRGVWR
jgi:micrococcal nuclease